MQDGTQVQLKSVTLQKYMSAQNGGGMNVSVDRDNPLEWETFKVKCIVKLLCCYLLVSRIG